MSAVILAGCLLTIRLKELAIESVNKPLIASRPAFPSVCCLDATIKQTQALLAEGYRPFILPSYTSRAS